MDLRLIETGDGGDLVMLQNDLSVIEGFQNMVYLALFGGNTEASTTTDVDPTKQNFDYWGNSLFDFNEPSVQFNSETERTLTSVALNSQGRILIQNAVNKDLDFMRAFATVTVEVVIESFNRVRIGVKLVEPDKLNTNEFVYIWDRTNFELTTILNGQNAVDPSENNYIVNGYIDNYYA